MTIPEWLTVDNVLTILGYLISAATFLAAFLRERQNKKTAAEALTLAINTLKVEDKMPGGSFSPALVAKVSAAAEALQVGEAAKAEVVKVLAEGQHVNDLKIGSINGKPIYLGSALGIGSALAAAIRKLRGIRLKI